MLERLRALFRYAPTKRLSALVIVCAPIWLLSGSQTGLISAIVVSVSLIVITIADASRIPGHKSIQLSRSLPPIVGVGETISGSYQIRSTWPASFRAFISDALPNGIEHSQESTESRSTLPPSTKPPSTQVLISAHGEKTLEPFSVIGRARGRWPLGPVALSVLSPFQLVRRVLKYYPNDTISVVPAFSENRRFRLAAIQQRMSAVGERALRRRGASTTFNNLRDYTIGDDPRHIDWKASARRNHLISREFTVEQGQTILIAIDAGRMMTQIAGDRPRFEYALASALTLADVALTAGDRVGLMIFNEEVREYVPPARGNQTLTHIRHALTRASATLAEPDYSAAFRTLATRQRKRALIVLFTDVIDARSSRAVIANTSRSVGRHLPLVVALRNEQLSNAAIPAEGNSDYETYTNVAAEELLSAREEALRSMRQVGVVVLDTPPQTMTADLINQYLGIKDRGLL